MMKNKAGILEMKTWRGPSLPCWGGLVARVECWDVWPVSRAQCPHPEIVHSLLPSQWGLVGLGEDRKAVMSPHNFTISWMRTNWTNALGSKVPFCIETSPHDLHFPFSRQISKLPKLLLNGMFSCNQSCNPAWYYSNMVISTEDSEHDDKDVEMPPDVRGDGCLNTADGWLLGWWSRAPATCYCLLFGLRCVRISTSRTERSLNLQIQGRQ